MIGRLINIIKSPGSDDTILVKVKSHLNNKKIPINTILNGTTPLTEAAIHGYVKILDYLINEKKFDPREEFQHKNCSFGTNALRMAIYHKQIDAAIFLIKNMQGFDIHEEYGCLDLMVAIECDQLILVEEILKINPSLLLRKSKFNENLLHLAVSKNAKNVVSYLIKRMPPNELFLTSTYNQTPYDLALHYSNDVALNSLLELVASPLSCSHDMLFPIDEVLKGSGSDQQKRSCANILLAAGAGLNIFYLPDELFSLFQLEPPPNSKLGPFLLLAEEKQPNGTWKKRLISDLSVLEKNINLPEWRFNKKLLYCAIQEPNICNLVHIKKIQELLLKEEAYQLYQPPINFEEQSIEDLSIQEMTSVLNHYYIELSLEAERLTKSFNDAEKEDETINIIENFFIKLSLIFSFMNHSNASLKNRVFDCAQTLLDSVIWHMIENPGTQQSIYLEIFINQISSLIKKYKWPLKKFIIVEGSLLQNKIDLELELAAQYLQQEEKSLAFITALNVTHEIDKYEKELSRCLPVKLKASLISAATDVHHGWLTEANKKIDEAKNVLDILPSEAIQSKSNFILDLSESIISLLNQANEYSFDGLKIMNKITDILIKLNNFGIIIYDKEKEIENYKIKYLKQNMSYVRGKLSTLQNDVFFDENENLITYPLNKEKNNRSIKNFLKTKKISGIIFDNDYIYFSKEFMFLENFKKHVKNLIEIIQNNRQIDLIVPFKEPKELPNETLPIQQLSELYIQNPKPPKKKTKGVPNQNITKIKEKVDSNKNNNPNDINNPKFNIPDGYSPAVPIKGSGFPVDTLFISMPINREEFFPFLKLIKTGKNYHQIYSIAEKGHNQQGVKLGSRWIMIANKKHKEEFARVKILGADGHGKIRCWGKVAQVITLPNKEVKKLYILDTISDKDEEERKSYKILKN